MSDSWPRPTGDAAGSDQPAVDPTRDGPLQAWQGQHAAEAEQEAEQARQARLAHEAAQYEGWLAQSHAEEAQRQAAWQAYYQQQAAAQANQQVAGHGWQQPAGQGWQQPAYGYPAQPAWTPPPKPGLLPLRPLGFGTLLAAPFRALRRNTAGQFGSAAFVQLLITLAIAPFVAFVYIPMLQRLETQTAFTEEFVSGAIGWLIVSGLLTMVVSVVMSTFLQAVLIHDIASGTLGEKRRLGALWRQAARSFWPVLGASLLIGLVFIVAITVLIVAFIAAVSTVGGSSGGNGRDGVAGAVVLAFGTMVIGGLGLVVVFGWLATKLSVVASAIVLERIGPFQAIRRSWHLTQGYFWRTFGVIMLTAVIIGVATQIVSTPIGFISGLVASTIDPTRASSFTGAATLALVVAGLVGIVTGAVTSAIQTSLNGVIYLDLRMRKEALDLTLERHVNDRAAGLPTVDPFLPVPR